MNEQLQTILAQLDADYQALQAERSRLVADAQSRIAQLDEHAKRVQERWVALKAVLDAEETTEESS